MNSQDIIIMYEICIRELDAITIWGEIDLVNNYKWNIAQKWSYFMILQSELYIIGVGVAHFGSVTLGVAAKAWELLTENWGRV